MYNIVIHKKTGNECYGEYDIMSKDVVVNDFIIPYLTNISFYVDGSEVSHDDVKQIIVSESNLKIQDLIQKAKMVHKGEWYFATEENVARDKDFVKIVTQEILKEASQLVDTKQINNEDKLINNKKVFVVYGHDENIELKVIHFITRLGLEPVILSEEANCGKTIIEKLEAN